MKKRVYKEKNVRLEWAGGPEPNEWVLSVLDQFGVWEGNFIAIEQEEIQHIVDVCIQMLIDHEKPPKGLRKVKVK